MAEPTVHELSPKEHALLAHRVMRRQAGLSLRVAAVFAVLLLGLPLVNALWPELANAEIGGFTATWLFLAVLFYPITVALSFYFVRKSDQIEAECTDWRAVLAEDDRVKEAGR
jgi:sterol desaturase/sphingolipid hydroxylase (fatty acid hydroxylase superfamily)